MINNTLHLTIIIKYVEYEKAFVLIKSISGAMVMKLNNDNPGKRN